MTWSNYKREREQRFCARRCDPDIFKGWTQRLFHSLSIFLSLVLPSHHNCHIGLSVCLSVCLVFIRCLTHYSCLCMRGVSVCFTLYQSNEPASFFALPFHLISINITEHFSQTFFFFHNTAGDVLMRASICSPLFHLHHYNLFFLQLQTGGYVGLMGVSFCHSSFLHQHF